MKRSLIIIDPQRDFTDPSGSLYVKGAEQDVDRLALLVKRKRKAIDDIEVTMDSHHRLDISHPPWLNDEDGNHPDPFTSYRLDGSPTMGETRDGQQVQVSGSRIIGRNLQGRERVYTAAVPMFRRYTLYYLDALLKGGRYPHVTWPEHCLIGTEGHSIPSVLLDALSDWTSRPAVITFVTKGSNIFTEHFGAVRAEVPDPLDHTTQTNTKFVERNEAADEIWLAGWARSHCLGNTGRDTVAEFGSPDSVKKMVLITDAMSDVPGFEQYGEAFYRDMMAMGARSATTAELMAA